MDAATFFGLMGLLLFLGLPRWIKGPLACLFLYVHFVG